jgi:NADPH-dependent glutamate synthase beta subunit-like oxidoreductase
MMTHQHARTESERCLQCFDAPCIAACPAHIDIPAFIAMIKSDNVRGAAEVVRWDNPMAATCGSICPQEVFCQSACTRGKQDLPIEIRDLHFFATWHEREHGFRTPAACPSVDTSMAVIGAGPAGLSCAFALAMRGYRVHVYDGKGEGGVPRHSIPSFRLRDEELTADTEFLLRFVTMRREDVDASSFAAIRGENAAVFVGVGLGRDRRLGIRGETLPGVLPVLEFLGHAKQANALAADAGTVVVVGGGNVSLDAAATARRAGAEHVTLLYRRGEREMKVWKGELDEARVQGVEIRWLTSPVEILGERGVTGVRVRRTRLSAERDASGRPVPVEVAGTDQVLEAVAVIVAIGQEPGAGWMSGVRKSPKGLLAVDRSFATSLPGVFAGGDCVGGEGTIVQAVAHGKEAAHAMHMFVQGRHS